MKTAEMDCDFKGTVKLNLQYIKNNNLDKKTFSNISGLETMSNIIFKSTVMHKNIIDFFNEEISPIEFSRILDDAYFVISQTNIANPNYAPCGEYPTDEVLYHLHRFKNVLKAG